MGFFSGIVKGITGAVSGIAKAVGTLGAIAIGAGIGFLVGGPMGAVVGATSALALTSGALTPTPDVPSGSTPVVDTGVRVQLQPNTENKIPVVYGSAYVKGIITDARISDNNKVMTYVMVLSEKTTTGTFNVNEIYWNDIKLTITQQLISGGTTLYNTVSTATNADGSTNSDFNYTFSGTTPVSQVEVHTFINGSENPMVSGHPYAYNIVPGWDNTWDMSGLVFVVVKVRYNAEKNITGLPTMTFKVNNSLKAPGDVWYDYLTNTRYGCGVDPEEVDNASVLKMNNEGNTFISSWTYSGTLDAATFQAGSYWQKIYINAVFQGDTATADDALAELQTLGFVSTSSSKYQVNGVISPDNTCMANLKTILLNCNSWGTYDYRQGKWKAIVNCAAANIDITNAFQFSDTNILSEISLTSTGLDQLYNSIELEFPATNIKDQKDYVTLDLPDSLINDYEPENQLKINIPLCNNSSQAIKLGRVYLKQAREDIAIEFTADYSALQVNAGEVVKITNDVYGWTNKLFRVMSVREAESDDGMLVAVIRCIEYNADIYTDEGFVDFIPSPNTNIPVWQKTTTPEAPTYFSSETNVSIPYFRFKALVPEGVYNVAEFWFSDDGGKTFSLANTIKSNGNLFVENEAIYSDFRGFPFDTYYIKVRMGKSTPESPTVFSNLSGSSQPYLWNPFGVSITIPANIIPEWTFNPVIIPSGSYGQTRTLQIRMNNTVIPVSTATDDTSMSNGSWRILDNGFQIFDTWTWGDVVYNTTYNTASWTLTTISDFNNAPLTQKQTPLIRYKDSAGNLSTFPATTTSAWREQESTDNFGQDGKNINIISSHQYFVRPTGVDDTGIFNYTPGTINIKVLKQNISGVASFRAVGSDGQSIVISANGDDAITLANFRFGNRDWVKILAEIVDGTETYYDVKTIYRVRESETTQANGFIANEFITLPVNANGNITSIIENESISTQFGTYLGAVEDTKNWTYGGSGIAQYTFGGTFVMPNNDDYKGKIAPVSSNLYIQQIPQLINQNITASKTGYSMITKSVAYAKSPYKTTTIPGQYLTGNIKELILQSSNIWVPPEGLHFNEKIFLKAVPIGLTGSKTYTWTAQPEIGNSISITGDFPFQELDVTTVNANYFPNNSTYVDITVSTVQQGTTYSDTTRIWKGRQNNKAQFYNMFLRLPADSGGNVTGTFDNLVGWLRYYEIYDQSEFFASPGLSIVSTTGISGTAPTIAMIPGYGPKLTFNSDNQLTAATGTVVVSYNPQPGGGGGGYQATLTIVKQIQGQ